MSPGIPNSMMSAFSTNNSNTTTLVALKLNDDRSNWADYKPHIQRALGLKGLWRHVEGTAIMPKPYALVTGVPVLADGMTQATEDQIEAREIKIIDYDDEPPLCPPPVYTILQCSVHLCLMST